MQGNWYLVRSNQPVSYTQHIENKPQHVYMDNSLNGSYANAVLYANAVYEATVTSSLAK